MKTLAYDRSNSWVTERYRRCSQQRTSGDVAFTTVASGTESRGTAGRSIATQRKAAVSDGDETARTE